MSDTLGGEIELSPVTHFGPHFIQKLYSWKVAITIKSVVYKERKGACCHLPVIYIALKIVNTAMI